MKKFSDLFLRQFLDKPIATYTHTANKEVVVSAVDVNTDTFTSVAHGLSNGNRIFPILNPLAGVVYPLQVYAGGLLQQDYFVVNKTLDTFQLSLTNGGVPINVTENTLMDLTKWHFEVWTTAITITNLPPSKKYRLKLLGKTSNQGYIEMIINNITPSNSMFVGSITAFSNLKLNNSMGSISTYLDIVISTVDKLYVIGVSNFVTANNANASQYTTGTQDIFVRDVDNYMQATDITAITLQSIYRSFVNGTVVEVYRA